MNKLHNIIKNNNSIIMRISATAIMTIIIILTIILVLIITDLSIESSASVNLH